MMQRPTLQDWLALDITLAQMKMLLLLFHERSLPVSEAAQALGVSAPTASQQIDRLVQAGLVQRIESSLDRRYTLVSLTSAGEQLISNLRQGQKEHVGQWIESLGSDERQQLCMALEVLVRLLTPANDETKQDQ